MYGNLSGRRKTDFKSTVLRLKIHSSRIHSGCILPAAKGLGKYTHTRIYIYIYIYTCIFTYMPRLYAYESSYRPSFALTCICKHLRYANIYIYSYRHVCYYMYTYHCTYICAHRKRRAYSAIEGLFSFSFLWYIRIVNIFSF